MARGVDTLLKDYRAKRDFSKTAEPDHGSAPQRSADRPTFVVQKHDASRLHYDFRLEWDGVLKSWAVTRGPSYDPADKRLAVRTEDHPLAYGGFEGIIPQGQYGGGTVMLWDRGTWEPVGDFEQGLKDGKLVFRLEGERLKGEWTLVRMKPRDGERAENWLLIKHREDDITPPRGDVLKKHVKSVATERTMAQIAKSGRTIAKSDLAATPPPERKRRAKTAGSGKTKPAAMPAWREPQLATLAGEAPEGDRWLSEMKYDGYRTLIAVAGGKARVFTRSGKDWSDRFPSVVDAAAALDTDGTLIDGEIVAFDKNGKTDFSSLQQGIKSGGRDLSCFCFDLLQVEGKDIAGLPLVERKARLEALLGDGSAPLIYSTHIRGNPGKVLQQICSAGHEGIVAKLADDPYRPGRGRSWLKIKCGNRQEFVVGGYKPSRAAGRAVASVLVGVHEGDGFIYKGRVGAFESGTLDELESLLLALPRRESPFEAVPADARRSTFVDPVLVVEVSFAEFTADGILRHAVVKGLREDKPADEVVLETTEGSTMSEHETRQAFAGVKLSSPDKVLFEDQGLTKADLAAHYERVAERMLPFVEKRLLSLVRCPEGAGGECFFQKHESRGFPGQIKKQEIAESDGKKAGYLYVDSLAGLIAGVQMGTLEFHIWGSRIDRVEQPDRLVFDLDPDEGLDFADVRAAAFDIRDRLSGLGLETMPMVTGGKGIHVVASLQRRAEWPEVKAFARGFAMTVSDDDPDRYVANMAKAKRKGRIFIDYLRNERGSTAIAPYSTRARAGAPVATPVSWEELEKLPAANTFRIADMEKRLSMKDPWSDAAGRRQSITRSMLEKVSKG